MLGLQAWGLLLLGGRLGLCLRTGLRLPLHFSVSGSSPRLRRLPRLCALGSLLPCRSVFQRLVPD